jgi:hypothetical protein
MLFLLSVCATGETAICTNRYLVMSRLPLFEVMHMYRFKITNTYTAAASLQTAFDERNGTYSLQLPLTNAANYSITLFVGGTPAAGGASRAFEVAAGPASAPVCQLDNLVPSGTVRTGGNATIQVIMLAFLHNSAECHTRNSMCWAVLDTLCLHGCDEGL